MKIYEQHTKLNIVTMLFGLPFFGGGCFFLYKFLDSSTNWGGGSKPSLLFGIPFTSLFIFIGLMIMFSRGGVYIDPFSRKGHTYWGLLFPMFYKRFSLDNIKFLILKKERRQSKNSSYYVYPLFIEMNNGKKIKIVSAKRNYHISRELAEKICRDTNLSFKNTVEGNVVLSPDQVDKSFIDKVKLERITPEKPIDSTITYLEKNGDVVIRSSFQTSIIAKLILMIFPISFGAFVYFVFQGNKSFSGGQDFFDYFILAFIALPVLIGLFKVLNLSGHSVSIKISHDYIAFKGSKMGKTHKIKFSEIDDIDAGRVRSKSEKPIPKQLEFLLTFFPHKITVIHGEKVSVISPFKSFEDKKYVLDLIKYSISKRI